MTGPLYHRSLKKTSGAFASPTNRTSFCGLREIMADKSVRFQLRCSNCDRVIATFPEGEQVESALLCPGCGATVTPAGPLGKLATKIKEAVEDMTGPGEDNSEKEDDSKQK